MVTEFLYVYTIYSKVIVRDVSGFRRGVGEVFTLLSSHASFDIKAGYFYWSN
jgi:hypothetical protein